MIGLWRRLEASCRVAERIAITNTEHEYRESVESFQLVHILGGFAAAFGGLVGTVGLDRRGADDPVDASRLRP